MERKTKEKKRKSNKKASISQNMFKRAATAENCRFSSLTMEIITQF